MPTEGRRAVFFDRDGTLMEDAHYCGDPAMVKVFIVTNQSGIGRGLITEAQYRAVQEEFLRQAGRDLIDASYYCPDAPGVPSTCRKPEPGMVLQASAAHHVDLAASYFVGDKSGALTFRGSHRGCAAITAP